MRLVWLILFFLEVPICFSGEPLEIIPGKWESNSKVTKLYETPLGAVYRFKNTIPFRAKRRPDSSPCPKKCDCDWCQYINKKWTVTGGFLEFNFLKNKYDNQRFVVLDFKIRAFPALEEKQVPEFRFQITRSAYTSVNNDYHRMNALLDIKSDHFFSFSSNYPFAGEPGFKLDDKHSFFLPPFEPLNVRVIFDTTTGKQTHFFYNAYQLVRINLEKPLLTEKRIEIRNFGILSMKHGSDKQYRTEYLEISDPVVYMTDDTKELEKLPQVKFTHYPYQAYKALIAEDDKRNDPVRYAKNSKNPDLQYAQALFLLYGSSEKADPSAAIDLLEKAAREHHIFALYELGTCYAFGYGVRPDISKALRYLNESADGGYFRARALAWLILWNQAHRPFFYSPELSRELDNIKKSWRKTEDHDMLFLRQIVERCVFTASFPSAKLLPGLSPLLPAEGSSVSGNIEFCDYQIKKKYWPGYLTKVYRESPNISPKQKTELLAAGTSAGDREAELALLIARAEAGELSEEDFSPQKQLRFACEPWYGILLFARSNPDFPGIAKFLSGDRRGAEREWKKSTHPATGLLRFLMAAASQNYKRYLPELIPAEEQELFDGLNTAAKNSNFIAQYWMGRLLLYDDLPRGERRMHPTARLSLAAEFLRNSAKTGFLPACYLLAELQAQDLKTGKMKFIEDLEDVVKVGYEPAILLKASILASCNDRAGAVSLWNSLAEKNNVDALRELALLEDGKTSGSAAILWARCIQTSRMQRLFDRYDLYWPEPYEELDQWRLVTNDVSPAIIQKMAEEAQTEDNEEFAETIRKKRSSKNLRRK